MGRLLSALLAVAAASAGAAVTVQPAGCPTRLAAEEQKKETIGFLTAAGQLCTGTLLSRHVVLTAAHCVEYAKPADVVFSLSPELDGPEAGVAAAAAEIRVFPRFTRSRGKEYGGGDLALVKLGGTEYGRQPAVFYGVADAGGELHGGSTAFLIGYGLNRETPAGLRRSRHVRFLDRTHANLSDGTRLVGGVYRFSRGDDGEIPCGGDSGSPVLKFVGGRTAIIAIHSASEAVTRRPRRGVASKKTRRQICRISSETMDTAIAPFQTWIAENWRAMEPDQPPYPCPDSQ